MLLGPMLSSHGTHFLPASRTQNSCNFSGDMWRVLPSVTPSCSRFWATQSDWRAALGSGWSCTRDVAGLWGLMCFILCNLHFPRHHQDIRKPWVGVVWAIYVYYTYIAKPNGHVGISILKDCCFHLFWRYCCFRKHPKLGCVDLPRRSLECSIHFRGACMWFFGSMLGGGPLLAFLRVETSIFISVLETKMQTQIGWSMQARVRSYAFW